MELSGVVEKLPKRMESYLGKIKEDNRELFKGLEIYSDEEMMKLQ